LFLGRFTNALDQPYETQPFYDLKEKLPDGEYIYLGINRKDSANKLIMDIITIKGQCTISLRQGKFEYYRKFVKNGNEVTKQPLK
jgi:hypothetical protein